MAVGEDFDFQISPGVDTGRVTAQKRRVAHQYQALQALGPGEYLEDSIGQVEAVGDEACGKLISRKLLPNVIAKPRHCGVASVPQVGGYGRARGDGAAYLFRRCAGMADGDDDAKAYELAREFQCSFPLRGYGHELDKASGRLLPLQELLEPRIPHIGRVVGSPGAVLGGDIGPFDMDGGNRCGEEGGLFPGLSDEFEVAQQEIPGPCDNGGNMTAGP
ncbi:MAG: hypothetical protein FD137_2487 [Spirochaetes bacterium]|nr:MAG: hypothetical protein FD137_2487 [Spirochaetota bacterium]